MPETKTPEDKNKEFLVLVAHLPIQDSMLLARYIDKTILEKSRATAIGFAEWIRESGYISKGDMWYSKYVKGATVTEGALYDLYLINIHLLTK